MSSARTVSDSVEEVSKIQLVKFSGNADDFAVWRIKISALFRGLGLFKIVDGSERGTDIKKEQAY